jgi:2-hydroxychromene-2-carboxylate isomerase
MVSGIDPGTVVVCIDFKQPRAYLAHRPTRELEVELGCRFDWQPFLVAPPKPPPAPQPDEDRGTMHRRLRAEYTARDVERYAHRLGLPLEDPYRDSDSAAAALGLLWCNARSSELARQYVDRVFAQRWGGSLELSSSRAIGALLAELGDAEGWDAYVEERGPAALAAARERLSEAGVFDVPMYLYGGEVFQGRQHLPMLRWLLTERQGEPPL